MDKIIRTREIHDGSSDYYTAIGVASQLESFFVDDTSLCLILDGDFSEMGRLMAANTSGKHIGSDDYWAMSTLFIHGKNHLPAFGCAVEIATDPKGLWGKYASFLVYMRNYAIWEVLKRSRHYLRERCDIDLGEGEIWEQFSYLPYNTLKGPHKGMARWFHFIPVFERSCTEEWA